MHLTIYTDGSCIGNPGPGGWAALIIDEENQETAISGHQPDTTNNRMEMQAIIEALKHLHAKHKDLTKYQIDLYSDSNLIIQTLNQGWKKKANTDLWADIDRLRAWQNITWHWVKGHSTNKYNNIVDELAQKAARKN
ncbi:ribonuclease HI [Candidatus Gracilibacteria bacterium]|nr:ribonuclease HI [Candidatus Gracilibacteria bacterium]